MLYDELALDAAVIGATREHVDTAGEPLEHIFARLDQSLWLRRMRTQQQLRILTRGVAEIDARLAALNIQQETR